jgi:hypothetical protein
MDTVTGLLNGRHLPSRVQARLEKAIANGDERIMKILEGSPTIQDVCKPIIADLEVHWNTCYENCSLYKAKELSNADRKLVTSLPSINLTYGEVRFDSLTLAMAGHIDMKDKKVFYDVGSGSGRGCFTAALVHDFTKIRGVEIVRGLHNAAVSCQEVWDSTVKATVDEESKALDVPTIDTDLAFKMDDFRTFDWSDADLVWANSTCFGSTLMGHLSSFSERMKEGSHFITLTQRLTSDHWELVCPGSLYPMSWGSATIYIWKKVRPASTVEATPVADTSTETNENASTETNENV